MISAQCDTTTGEFVLRYSLKAAELPRFDADTAALRFSVDDVSAPLELRTVTTQREQVGRIKVSKRLIETLESPMMVLEAENQMGEPWYFGRQPALIQVAKRCLNSSVPHE